MKPQDALEYDSLARRHGGKSTPTAEKLQVVMRGMGIDEIIRIPREQLGYSNNNAALSSVKDIAKTVERDGVCTYKVTGHKFNGESVVVIEKTLDLTQ